jgi:peptidoglycan/LPS O-acetylase OafA/YrhL
MAEPVTTSGTTSGTVARDRVLDGIRGYAILLVVLSHLWAVAPTGDLVGGPWNVLFSSGNYAVTFFFVVGGYLATSSMLREIDRTDRLRPGVAFVRRWIRLSAHVYPLVIVMLAMTSIDYEMMVDYSATNTRGSALHVFTYTWTGYILDHPLEARPDLGHLWYVCTDLWAIGVVLVLAYLLGRWRIALLASLGVALVVVYLYRDHVVDTYSDFQALFLWQTRADGILWGAVAAVVTPWLTRSAEVRRMAPWAGLVAAVALVPLAWLVNDSDGYLGFWGVVLSWAVMALVVSTRLAPPWRPLERVLGNAPARIVGRLSLVLYIWHYPVFWYWSRQAQDWSWQLRTFVALATSLVIALAAQALIERPAQRWLRSSRWHVLDEGFGPAIVSAARRGRDEARERIRATRHHAERDDELTGV